MELTWIEPRYLVLTAGVLFTLGYLVTNQIVLRWLLLAGTGFYLAYYFTAADTPLWEAIYTSGVMGAANLIGLSSLYWRRSTWVIPRQHRDLYRRFKDLPPGDFRALVNLARRETLTSDQALTQEGQPVEHLYYVVSGVLQIEKRGEHFPMPAGVFVGEVAYLTKARSSATTYLGQGAEVLIWDVAQLRRRATRNPRLGLALQAMISKDLAIKVAFSVAPRAGAERRASG